MKILKLSILVMISTLMASCLMAQTVSNNYNWALEEVDLGVPGMTTDDMIAEATRAASNSSMKITMSTVGFDIGAGSTAEKYLQKLASVGGGSYYKADAGGGLTAALSGAASGQKPGGSAQPQSNQSLTTLKLNKSKVKAGETIEVVHSALANADVNAWIGFYETKQDAPDEYISYTFLKNLSKCLYDVEAPSKPGREYHFRVFSGNDKELARSTSIEIEQ